jgi:hypothetical protein
MTDSAVTGPDMEGDVDRDVDRDVDYVLPLRWTAGHDPGDLAELTEYLRRLRGIVGVARVVVVDASPAPLFAAHARAWSGLALHIRPDADVDFANGKVTGVLTGVRRARSPHVIVADDDVRYDAQGLRAVVRLLGTADLVRPQNYFDPLPWHARWDTARSLLNRVFGGDYPGTFGIRRDTFSAMGGYDGNVLFENLELIRTVRAYGGIERRPPGLYVRRLPPDARHFWGQRVRQAYDDIAQPARMTIFLAVLPALATAVARSGPRAAAAGAAITAVATIGLAEIGRRRGGGAQVFPRTAALFAPVWAFERAICVWPALAARLGRGGIVYAGRRIGRAAHSVRELSRDPRWQGHGSRPACATRRKTASSRTGHSGTAPPSGAPPRPAGRPGSAT